MSTSSVDPSDLFGGEWERIQDRFLLAAGTSYSAGATGGEATHLLTANESGTTAHGHGFTQPTVNGGAVTNGISGGSHSHQIKMKKEASSGSNIDRPRGASVSSDTYITSLTSEHTHNLPTHTHSVSGGAVANSTAANAKQAHNNMPPYLAVYVWKRVA